MIREVNNPLEENTEHWINVLQASIYNHNNLPVWIVKLAVGKGQKEVDGWVFIEPKIMELRFEIYPSMEPPGFLSGRYLSQSVEESSLAFLFDCPCDNDLFYIKSYIIKKINNCIFCVRTLTDITSDMSWHEAISYRHKD